MLIVLSYPSFSEMKSLMNETKDMVETFFILLRCNTIDQILTINQKGDTI